MEEVLKQIAALSADLKGEFKSGLMAVEARLGSTQASLDATASSLQSIHAWRVGVDTQVSDLTASMDALRKQVDRVVVGVGLSALGSPPGAAASATPPATADAGSSPKEHGSGQSGHGVQHDHRGMTSEQLALTLSSPVTGTKTSQSVLEIVPVTANQHATSASHTTPVPPPADFPRFDGENPMLWQKAAEKYFRLFAVDPSYRVEYATMHFSGNAALWLQSVEHKLASLTWDQWCELLSKHFDRGQYQLLYRQCFRLRQTGTVVAYIEKFDSLMHHMLAYKPDLDPTFFTTRFIEGLSSDIRRVVMIQRPEDLETAVSLALLQEEIEDDVPKFPGQQGLHQRQFSRQSFSPTVRQPAPVHSEDKSAAMSNKVSALKAYRRARNLCFTCGEKYAPGHKCGNTVQLHVVEELLSMLQVSDSEGEACTAETEVFEDAITDSHEVLMSISKQAVNGSEAPRSMRLSGQIQGRDVLILIDSGSSSNFVSENLASKLTGVQQLDNPIKVKVAGGGVLEGNSEIPDCVWTCQGNSFATSLKVLPLQCYDVILGMQWLEEMGLMTTHWQQKWFQFEWKGKICHLQGITANTKQCEHISFPELQGLHQQNSVQYLVQLYFTSEAQSPNTVPHIVAMVLDTYAEIFEEPKGLPPHRKYDHTIPLMPGASPVNLHPYRYSPMQKSEIEKQVKELMAQGVIQLSSSPFASPVLLVGKKDLTWRLCVDFRHLNALTIKNKYPLPVIDELLDELAGAQWFTSLDLRSGYHQIRMAEGEEYKTAFQTHHGHFEYKVMPYGVTGGPATFQGVMNDILAPLLRKYALVFVDDILIYSKSLQEHVKHLESVFSILLKHNLKVKKSKCAFAQQEIRYLGHLISSKGVATDKKKIEPILKCDTSPTYR
ncbi:uncharacterized protein [Lolium perenne]|uniref:uncharacterized protein n=1 Tax=Lolium perenne TaxID=4522 RepID=UPI003A98D1D0